MSLITTTTDDTYHYKNYTDNSVDYYITDNTIDQIQHLDYISNNINFSAVDNLVIEKIKDSVYTFIQDKHSDIHDINVEIQSNNPNMLVIHFNNKNNIIEICSNTINTRFKIVSIVFTKNDIVKDKEVEIELTNKGIMKNIIKTIDEILRKWKIRDLLELKNSE